jgi:small subunit ribosomal protein S4
MGDPRKIRKKFTGPKHPWKRDRIEEEKELMKKYSPKNHKEIWRMDAILENLKHQAKKLSSLRTQQAEKEKKLLLKRLENLGLIKEGDSLPAILVLKLEDIMERRLQTIAFRKSLAKSIKQARQFITHAHIAVRGKVITSPSYLVLKSEEEGIGFVESSPLASAEHPERQVAKQVESKKEERAEKAAKEKRDSKENRRREPRKRYRKDKK